MQKKKWKSSQFNRSVRLHETKGRILYNSFTGAISTVSSQENPEVHRLLGSEGFIGEMSEVSAELRDGGFLVPRKLDENLQASKLHELFYESDRAMHLVLMPTEACNFRCTYCYQSFSHGCMSEETIQGLKAYVSHAAQRLNHLSISWFGGEPLLVPKIIAELSESFQEICSGYDVEYTADMSTNGYLLSKERFLELLKFQIRRFMITIDGVGLIHNRRRRLQGAEESYERIIENLKELRKVDDVFEIDLRINFDEENVTEVPELLEELSRWFKGDARFQILVRPVGRWDGPQDERIPVCDRTAQDTHLWELTDYGLEQGLLLSTTIGDSLLPSGSVCYAAKPNSLVIGASGRLHKCSVALHDEINQVGQLHTDGSLELDTDKVSIWTRSGEEQDAVCQACFFRPACQGNHCPLYRMRTGKRPCPHEKRKIIEVLNLIWKNDVKGGEESYESDTACCDSNSSEDR